jgi:hypothetical protein
MSKSMPPPLPTDERRFTKDVAKQVDRRQIKRRMVRWTGLAGLVAAGVLYLRCGHGFGLGGNGKGPGEGDGTPQTLAGPSRCEIRVTHAGITVGGKPKTRDEAVAGCKANGGPADIIVTGDARQGDWTDLYASLVAAGVKDINKREPSVGSAAP